MGVRVIFAAEAFAEANKRPLLDIGAAVSFLSHSGLQVLSE